MVEEPSQEHIKIPIAMSRPYRWATGRYLGKLYKEARDNKKLVTNRCPKCKELLWPPRPVCGRNSDPIYLSGLSPLGPARR